MTLSVVVTRYGGHRHLADGGGRFGASDGRHSTVCRGTSAWTLESWQAAPDHPTLTVEQMRDLPPCTACAAVVRIDRLAELADAGFGEFLDAVSAEPEPVVEPAEPDDPPRAAPLLRWSAVLRVWAADNEGVYGYRHDAGTTPTEAEPAVLVATLRALANDIEARA